MENLKQLLNDTEQQLLNLQQTFTTSIYAHLPLITKNTTIQQQQMLEQNQQPQFNDEYHMNSPKQHLLNQQIEDNDRVFNTLQSQLKSLKKVQNLSDITNPLYNNEFLFKRLSNYIDLYNTHQQSIVKKYLRSPHVNDNETYQENTKDHIESDQQQNLSKSDLEKIEKALYKHSIASGVRQSVLGHLQSIKKDRVLQKSMLACIHQWVERMQEEFVNVNEESFNPFKSIIKRNGGIDDNSSEHQNNFIADLKIATSTNNYGTISPDKQIYSTLNYNNPNNFDTIASNNEQMRKQQDLQGDNGQFKSTSDQMFMTFHNQKDSPQAMKLMQNKYSLAEGSIAEATTTLPQSERYLFTKSSSIENNPTQYDSQQRHQDYINKQSNNRNNQYNSTSPFDQNYGSKRMIIQPQSTDVLYQEHLLTQQATNHQGLNTVQTQSKMYLREESADHFLDEESDMQSDQQRDTENHDAFDSLQNPSSKIYLTHEQQQQASQTIKEENLQMTQKYYNPFTSNQNSKELRLPEITNTNTFLKQTFTSFNSTTSNNHEGIVGNYPFGIVYSAKNKQTNSKFFKQFVPMRGVPKIIDLTKENISDQFIPNQSNNNLSLLDDQMLKQQQNMNKTFMQGGKSIHAQQQKMIVPDPYLFEEFKASLQNYGNMDVEDMQNDPAYQKKERFLNLQAQQAIYTLGSYKPYHEINLDYKVNNGNKLLGDASGDTGGNLGDTMNKRLQGKRGSHTLSVKTQIQDQVSQNKKSNQDLDQELFHKIKQMEQTIKASSQIQTSAAHQQIASNYPFLSRGIEIENQSLEEIEFIKKHLSSIGMNVPAQVLKNAIFLPKDMDAEGRKYPKIIDQLMSSSQFITRKRKSASQAATNRKRGAKSNNATNYTTVTHMRNTGGHGETLPIIGNNNKNVTGVTGGVGVSGQSIRGSSLNVNNGDQNNPNYPTTGYNNKLFYKIN
eukprot:403333501